jgi:hypothetical protein
VHLQKKGEQWIVEDLYGAYADEAKIDALFNALTKLKGDVRSDDRALLADYGITDAQGIHVRLEKAGAILAQLVIGTKKSGLNGSFVRVIGSNAVYAVDENILMPLGFWGDVKEEDFSAETWTDKKPLAIESLQVESLKLVEKDKTLLDIARVPGGQPGEWRFAATHPKPVDPAKVTALLTAIKNLRAQSVVSPQDWSASGTADWTLSLGKAGGKTLTLSRSAIDKDRCYMKPSDREYAFEFAAQTLTAVQKADADLFQDEPPAVKEQAPVKPEPAAAVKAAPKESKP